MLSDRPANSMLVPDPDQIYTGGRFSYSLSVVAAEPSPLEVKMRQNPLGACKREHEHPRKYRALEIPSHLFFFFYKKENCIWLVHVP